MLGRRRRRGANAIEFVMIAPVLVGMAMGMVDFGWFFMQEALVANALSSAVMAGSAHQPAPEDAPGTCTPCVAAVQTHAEAALANLGVAAVSGSLVPTIEPLSGTCALVLEPTLEHTELVGLVPVPEAYSLRVVALAQLVRGC